MKVIFTLLLFTFLQQSSFGQIKIDDVGDGWRDKVDSALLLIKCVDVEKYQTVIESCNHISYWNGSFSTTEDSATILITQKDMNSTINNIAAIIVHESKHLWYKKRNITLPPNDEEVLCYRYELDFLQKIPNVEPWLIGNAKKMIIFYNK